MVTGSHSTNDYGCLYQQTEQSVRDSRQRANPRTLQELGRKCSWEVYTHNIHSSSHPSRETPPSWAQCGLLVRIVQIDHVVRCTGGSEPHSTRARGRMLQHTRDRGWRTGGRKRRHTLRLHPCRRPSGSAARARSPHLCQIEGQPCPC